MKKAQLIERLNNSGKMTVNQESEEELKTMYINLLRENYIELWSALENGDVQADFFELRANFRNSIQGLTTA